MALKMAGKMPNIHFWHSVPKTWAWSYQPKKGATTLVMKTFVTGALVTETFVTGVIRHEATFVTFSIFWEMVDTLTFTIP
jgi:hypothetical protein